MLVNRALTLIVDNEKKNKEKTKQMTQTIARKRYE